MALDDYKPENLPLERLIIFVVATTGQGDPPGNMKKFWRFLLQKNLPINLLQNLNYAVLGLGDSSYEKYNFAAKKLDKRIAQCGGIQLLSIGLADDQHDLGIDGTIEPWTNKLWKIISEKYFLANSIERFDEEIIERFDVKILNSDKVIQNYDIYREEFNVNDQLKAARVVENSRITSSEHFQDVRLLKFKIENIEYQPGDILYVRPKNSVEQIKSFFDLLHELYVPLYSHTVISITEKEIKLPMALKKPVELYKIVEQYWDLNYKPRRSTMRVLASISDNELEKDKLHEMSTIAGQEDFLNYVHRPKRNIIEVLRDFPHTARKLNERILFEIMPAIKPRAFSIASSNNYTPNEVHLLVAVVKYNTWLVAPRLGLCSNWLKSLECENEIICWIQKGTFKFDLSLPMILIGPGTGVASFRSLLLDAAAVNRDLRDTILFFGCRNREKDYHCREDFERLARTNNLKVFCAFSRDQEDKM